ncbi:hypothetical protein [Fictibacillus sp. NRS-1165]|uniref:hypothetical protein n=1 Tax=Fictibacillus sp. NRS-1165 TaxID=3144463 RepID=UPI003D1F2CBC
MCFFKRMDPHVQRAANSFQNRFSKTALLVLVSIASAITALIQSAGGTLPAVGLIISPFSTLPVVLITIISPLLGIYTFFLTGLLLLLVQPSELLIFLFTTGLLGVGLGHGFTFFQRRILIASIGSLSLFPGICIMLLGFQFPLFGPEFQSTSSFYFWLSLFLFSCGYSLVWVEITFLIFKKYVSRRLRSKP